MKRREFLKSGIAATAGIIALPTFIPSAVFGKVRPNEKINIGVIGCGRIARNQDIPGALQYTDLCRFVAVADVDIKRAKSAKELIEKLYVKHACGYSGENIKVYQDYREMLKDKSIDAVLVCTPDHWHAQPAIEAALAGKDVYVEKPITLTIAEGRQLSDVAHRTGCILQVGSQQRSMTEPQFHQVCQLVRNGAVGEIKHVYVGLPGDPGCGEEPKMAVPENLNYDMWLGSTPEVYYTEKRVHPQKDFSRPGWLRCEQFGAGMITGWGAHHVDIAHWGMGAEFTGPIEIEGEAEFPKSGLWDVHGNFKVQAKYANGVIMDIGRDFACGTKFEGDKGWIFVGRGDAKVTASDPDALVKAKAIECSDPKLLEYPLGADAIKLYESPEHHLNWLQCIRSRQLPVAPAEVGHRSCSACLLAHIAMKTQRKLTWDPQKEQFVNDRKANKMISRAQRKPYGTNYVLK